jgi:hypothetical protein
MLIVLSAFERECLDQVSHGPRRCPPLMEWQLLHFAHHDIDCRLRERIKLVGNHLAAAIGAKQLRGHHFQGFGGFDEARAGKTVFAVLVFLYLLKRHAELGAKIALRHFGREPE